MTKNILLIVALLSMPLHAAQVVGPNPPPTPPANSNRIDVKQGVPPLLPLTLQNDDGTPIEGKVIKWIGPIGPEAVAKECNSGLLMSTAVLGSHSFTAVIVPPAVTKPEDIEVVTFVVVVSSNGAPQPPPDTNPPDTNPPPVGINTDLEPQAKQWLATVKVSSQVAKSDVAKAINEIVKAQPPLGITEMELFLGLSLPFAIGDKLADWSTFASSANLALDGLKTKGATADQYREALSSIARALQ